MQYDSLNRNLEQLFPGKVLSRDEFRGLEAALDESDWSRKSVEDLHKLRRSFIALNMVAHFQERDLENCLRQLTNFYDRCVRGIWEHVCKSAGVASDRSGIGIFALGKWGSEEVNLDSDLDLVILRGSDVTETSAQKGERVVQAFLEVIGRASPQGHLPRCDLDLRPYGNSGALVSSVRQAQRFYWQSPDLWNRLSWLRGRFVCGDASVQVELNEWLPSYVYPRHLDFRMTESLDDLHRKLARHPQHQHDAQTWRVKFGRGGIREVEFLIHAHVLIHGGRRPAGRSGNIFDGIRFLRKHQIVTDDVGGDLSRCYSALRRLEHFTQFSADRRTHDLARADEKHRAVVETLKLGGFTSVTELFALGAQLFDHQFRGRKHEISKETVDVPEPLRKLLEPYTTGKAQERWTMEAKRQWERLLPLVLAFIRAKEDQAELLNAFLSWVDALRVRGGYFQLLEQNPVLLNKLLTILSVRQSEVRGWLARPKNIENILLNSWHEDMPFETYWTLWCRSLGEASPWTPEERVEQLRECQRAFALEVLCRSMADPKRWREHQRAWNFVADTVLAEVIAAQWSQRQPAIDLPRGSSVSWCLLGSHAAGTADLFSDLDLLVIFHADDRVEIPPELVRFTQRVTNVLATTTASGTLYPVDFRLRPSGNRSPLVISSSYFLQYARTQPQIWEWMSWFRSREVLSMSENRIDRGSQNFSTRILERLLEDLRAGKKKFSLQDVSALLQNIDDHRRQSPKDTKWVPGGLIELDIMARLNSWKAGRVLGGDFESLCRATLSEDAVRLAYDRMKQDWFAAIGERPVTSASEDNISLSQFLKNEKFPFFESLPPL